MTADGPVSDWTKDVIEFLSENVPRETNDVLDPVFSSTSRIGCGALIALGQANETDSGVVRRRSPELPSTLPRWDDICIAVLRLADQQGKLTYMDGSKPHDRENWSVLVPVGDGKAAPKLVSKVATKAAQDVLSVLEPLIAEGRWTDEAETVDWVMVGGKKPAAPPNIAATDALGPVKAAQDVLSVLEALGLIAEGRWTDDAETVLWRCPPRALSMDILSDPRFAEAVQKAVDTIPDDIRAEINRLTTATEKDVAADLALSTAFEELHDRYRPKSRIGSRSTVETARRRVILGRRSELDWLFFRRWRLADGWLSTDQAKRALEVFDDPLAIRVRSAVVVRLHPDRPEFSKFR